MDNTKYNLGKGYWPHELNQGGKTESDNPEEDYPPWEDWSMVLFGSEAGDYLEDEEDINLVLKSMGYRLVKSEKETSNE